ncbi:lysozyme-like [Uloborus diversus]|uniref:lysozyme-like n=1 Tax=Uloborus diversus TaxID=327109 RepID=UPI00240A26DD|nr:lysozyme-like [Uloborus diversus]
MASLTFLLLLQGVLLATAQILKPCDVAETMMNLGEKRTKASHWVCLAKFVSGFNTQALGGPYPDGSYDFGVFQINDRYCKLGSKESCGVPCTDLVKDNLLPSAKCALKIYQKVGFQAWPKWKDNCQNQDTLRFISKCSLKSSFRKMLSPFEDDDDS